MVILIILVAVLIVFGAIFDFDTFLMEWGPPAVMGWLLMIIGYCVYMYNKIQK